MSLRGHPRPSEEFKPALGLSGEEATNADSAVANLVFKDRIPFRRTNSANSVIWLGSLQMSSWLNVSSPTHCTGRLQTCDAEKALETPRPMPNAGHAYGLEAKLPECGDVS